MPKSGSQLILCDLPVRFDTYEGCSHACKYCFANRKRDISKVGMGESVNSLKDWVAGKRNKETKIFDWDIPLHWGGMSDPFQPIERKTGRSLDCLKVFAETQYPFVVSTKNKLIAEEPYFSLICQCNCVVQFSCACPSYDRLEKGASTYQERVDVARKISKHKRVIMRVQPYIYEMFTEIYKCLQDFADAGVYGVVFESMKYFKKKPNTIHLGNDFVYPTELLIPQFEQLKKECHRLGMKFYSGENRLRSMGDSLCCCGIDGMGWKPNTANLNHLIYDKEGVEWRDTMGAEGSGVSFHTLEQSSLNHVLCNKNTYKQLMMMKLRTMHNVLLPDHLTTKKKK